jgi:hypothetical protein
MFVKKKQYRGASDLLSYLHCGIFAIVMLATFVIVVPATLSGQWRPIIGVAATLPSWFERPCIVVPTT